MMVILVEPQPRMVRLIRTIVERSFAAEVVAVDDPEKLWSVAAQSKPDLLIIDVASRQYQGFDIPRQLKLNQATAEIPVVALGIVREQAEIARAAGFSGSIAFPFSVRDVVEAVRGFQRPESQG